MDGILIKPTFTDTWYIVHGIVYFMFALIFLFGVVFTGKRKR